MQSIPPEKKKNLYLPLQNVQSLRTAVRMAKKAMLMSPTKSFEVIKKFAKKTKQNKKTHLSLIIKTESADKNISVP